MPPRLDEYPGFPPPRAHRAMKPSPAGRADAGFSRVNCITLADEGRYLLLQAAPRRFQVLGQDHVVRPAGWRPKGAGGPAHADGRGAHCARPWRPAACLIARGG